MSFTIRELPPPARWPAIAATAALDSTTRLVVTVVDLAAPVLPANGETYLEYVGRQTTRSAAAGALVGAAALPALLVCLAPGILMAKALRPLFFSAEYIAVNQAYEDVVLGPPIFTPLGAELFFTAVGAGVGAARGTILATMTWLRLNQD